MKTLLIISLLACVLLATAIRTNNDLEDVDVNLQTLYKENPVEICDKLDAHYEPKDIYDLRVNVRT